MRGLARDDMLCPATTVRPRQVHVRAELYDERPAAHERRFLLCHGSPSFAGYAGRYTHCVSLSFEPLLSSTRGRRRLPRNSSVSVEVEERAGRCDRRRGQGVRLSLLVADDSPSLALCFPSALVQANASNNALASCKSLVSNPSVNQP